MVKDSEQDAMGTSNWPTDYLCHWFHLDSPPSGSYSANFCSKWRNLGKFLVEGSSRLSKGNRNHFEFHFN